MTQGVSVSQQTMAGQLKHLDTVALTYSLNYPSFGAYVKSAALTRINAFYHARTVAKICALRTVEYGQAVASLAGRCADAPFFPYEASGRYTVTYNQGCLLSLYTDRYLYTGGAHGDTQRTAETWSTRTGRPLTLKELVPGGTQGIVMQIKAQLERKIEEGEGSYFEDAPDLAAQYFSPDHVYLTSQGLAVYYPLYAIAPYSSGIPVFILPYEGVATPSCIPCF